MRRRKPPEKEKTDKQIASASTARVLGLQELVLKHMAFSGMWNVQEPVAR